MKHKGIGVLILTETKKKLREILDIHNNSELDKSSTRTSAKAIVTILINK